jgi:predicted xylose isomerase-like sugar epimerase
MSAGHLAKEADRLQNDPIFTEALRAIRADALDALAVADADDKTTILRLQQKVAVIDEIRNVLVRYVLQGTIEPEGNGSSYA